MTDQPPPTDKKPRRRAAPRKRAPRAKKTVEVATVDTASPVAPDAPQPVAPVRADAGSGAQRDRVSAGPARRKTASEVLAATEARLDPRPLDDSGDRGDAPATDAPGFATDRVPTTPVAPPSALPLDPGDARGDRARTDAPQAPSPAGSGSPPPAVVAPVGKQASLRPGELIRVPLSVRWRDLDAFNHVNNSKYLSYLEEARLRWMLSVPGMGLDDNVAPVVAASTLNYRRPIEWPGDVVIELFVERLGGSSLTIGHRIVDAKESGVLYCDGNVVMVWIDRNSGRSAPLPESVRVACR